MRAQPLRKPEPTFVPFMFDTHKYIKFLKSKGIKEPHAESIVQVVSDSREFDIGKIATKEQVVALEKQVEGLEKQVVALEKRFDRFEIEVKEEFKDIREDMKDFRKEIRVMFRWAVGTAISGLVATATMLAFILPLLLKK